MVIDLSKTGDKATDPRITAIFGRNDEFAIAAMGQARELGRRVPKDLSIIGFDDMNVVSMVSPSLTERRFSRISSRFKIQR